MHRLLTTQLRFFNTVSRRLMHKKQYTHQLHRFCSSSSIIGKQILTSMKAAQDANQDIPTAFTEYFTDKTVSVRGALNLVLFEEFAKDPLLFLIGEEVALYNGAYKISKGLHTKYGDDRVIDTPITEMGFTGIGVGTALNGLHPIVEFMSFNFAMQAIDQIVNSAGKLLYMSGGTINVPITFRGTNGAAKAVAAQHSQCFSAWYSSVPGLKVAAIYDLIDAREMLKCFIRDPDPCVLLENEMMYGTKFKVEEEWFDPEFSVGVIGKARVMQSGTDITIGAHGRMVEHSLAAAKQLKEEFDVSVEVLNFRNLRPFDRDALLKSVKKTHRLVYVEEGWPQCGIAAEVCALVMESSAFDYLDSPVQRVCGTDVPMPYCPTLEEMVLPSVKDVVVAAKRALNLL